MNGKLDIQLEDKFLPSRNWSAVGGHPKTLGWLKKKKKKRISKPE